MTVRRTNELREKTSDFTDFTQRSAKAFNLAIAGQGYPIDARCIDNILKSWAIFTVAIMNQVIAGFQKSPSLHGFIQLAMPSQDCVGFDDSGDFSEGLFAKLLADLGQGPTLGIIKLNPTLKLNRPLTWPCKIRFSATRYSIFKRRSSSIDPEIYTSSCFQSMVVTPP